MSRHVVITSLELRSVWYYFRLTFLSMHIVRQLKEFRCLGWNSTGFGREHFTMTLWEDPAEIKNFMKADGAHRRAMGWTKKLATHVKVYTYPADAFPTWRDAKQMLRSNGRVINYR